MSQKPLIQDLSAEELADHSKRSKLALVGGVLVHLVLGSFYLWPNVIVYITSYFRLQENSDLTISTANLVFPVMIVCQSIAMPFGSKIGERIGIVKEIMYGAIIIAVSIFISSFFTNFWWFIIFYGIIFGLVNGALYILPIRLGFMYFPHKKGIVSGIIVCGFGMGAFFLSYVAKFIINPDNYSPEIYNSTYKEYYFDHRVADEVPYGIRVLSVIYLIVALLGVFLLKEPSKEECQRYIKAFPDPQAKHLDEKFECPNVVTALTTGHLYLIVFYTFLGSAAGGMLVPNIKNYGRLQIKDDFTLTTIAALGSLFNGTLRIAWGTLMDRFPYRVIALSNFIAQLIFIFTLEWISAEPWLYGIWVVGLYVCLGGFFATQPTVTARAFGHHVGTTVYGVVFFGFASGSIFQFFFVKFAVPRWGWSFIFDLYLWIVVLGIALTFVLNLDKKDWSKEHEKVGKHKDAELH